MNHIVYLDYKSRELDHLLEKTKDVILRGATGRKLPHGRVHVGESLYFCYNNAEKLIRAKAVVTEVLFTDKLSPEESCALVDSLGPRLQLVNPALARFRGKRYLSVITVGNVEELTPFSFDKTPFSNMDDWLPIEDIETVRIR